ncbi:hypothetical protein [Psychroserpens mesophilus]|uniref:hypothetical protein n=1 Tax=Psychroserpens mesophilus TaxID=325473 RepID=UPI003D64E095
MTQESLENTIIKGICNLDIKPLYALSENVMYSNLTKSELLEEFTFVFKDYKSKGVNKLTYKCSKCNYCLPLAKAFEFYNSENNEFIMRYIIHSDEDGCKVRLCENSPPTDCKEEIPF